MKEVTDFPNKFFVKLPTIVVKRSSFFINMFLDIFGKVGEFEDNLFFLSHPVYF
jgi:hypothetical protein